MSHVVVDFGSAIVHVGAVKSVSTSCYQRSPAVFVRPTVRALNVVFAMVCMTRCACLLFSVNVNLSCRYCCHSNCRVLWSRVKIV